MPIVRPNLITNQAAKTMSQDSIFSEIDEELRSDRMQNLWRRFGPWVIGGAVLIVVLVGANEGWRWYQSDISARSSDQFYEAFDLINAGDMEAGLAALNETVSAGSGQYPTLARFAQAALLAEEGKLTEATSAYDSLSNTLSDKRMRELALLLGASLRVDDGDVPGVQARIGGLISPDNPMRNMARELLGLAQYASGDIDAARATFSQILDDPIASQDLLRRAQLYDAQLQAEGAADPAASNAPASEPTLTNQ